MSRIGKLPVPIPEGVTVKSADGEIEGKGPKGTLTTRVPGVISVDVAEGEIRFTRPDDKRESRSLHGLARALTANMVTGVTEGFSKTLEIQGVGYRAQVKGGKLVLNLGLSHPVEYTPRDGIAIATERQGQVNVVTVTGIDKEAVGQTAAEIRAFRKPEPYKGSGIRYRGEHVRRKAGKSMVTA